MEQMLVYRSAIIFNQNTILLKTLLKK